MLLHEHDSFPEGIFYDGVGSSAEGVGITITVSFPAGILLHSCFLDLFLKHSLADGVGGVTF